MEQAQRSLYVIDAGGSGTRAAYQRDGKYYTMSMVSRLRKIPIDSAVYYDIPDKSDDFIILDCGIDTAKGRFVRGNASYDHRGSVVIQPDNQTLKVNQTVTYINIIHAVAKLLLPLKRQDIIDVELGLLIPASEFCSEKNLKDIPKKALSSRPITVSFPALDRIVTFKVDYENITIGGEGMMVAMDVCTKPEYSEIFRNADGLIVDVGRRSTDITPFKQGRAMKKAARSFSIGGIQVESNVSAELELKERPVPGGDIINVVSTGYAGKYKAEEEITRAVKELAGDLKEATTSVMAVAGMSNKNLSYIVLVGQLFQSSNNEIAVDKILRDELLTAFPEDIEVIIPENQEFANTTSMLQILMQLRDRNKE